MPTVAVQLIGDEGEAVSGILVSDPKVGEDCRVDIGASVYRIKRVRGWIGLYGSNEVIIFDQEGKRYHMSLLAKSNDFLL